MLKIEKDLHLLHKMIITDKSVAENRQSVEDDKAIWCDLGPLMINNSVAKNDLHIHQDDTKLTNLLLIIENDLHISCRWPWDDDI